MASDLEQATRLDGRSGRYQARLSEDWEIWGPNGGYLAAIALRAGGEVAEIERPASFYCHFLSSPAFDVLHPTSPPFSFWENVERRPVDQSTTDEPQAPLVRAWVRFRPTACFEDPFLDAARALILLDTYGFPAAYRKYKSWEYLAPNLDTSVWFHHFNPGCEWLLIDHECTVADHGLMGVSGRVWDTDGRLLATGSAQLCCIPNPRA
jgi:Thioesterase-like superfamily